MSLPTEPRPGAEYRRPDGNPSCLEVRSAEGSDLPLEELPRSAWLEAVHPEDRDRVQEAVGSGDDEIDIVYRITAPDDRTWVHERGSRTPDGDVVGYLIPASERAERRRRLEQQRERLDQFASVVSHDLRNPLSVAVGNLELARELDGEAADERLDRVEEALERMDELISDLLSLAREGQSVEAAAEADLRTVADRAWSTVGSAADARLVVDDSLPTVECDRSRLREVLENLFRNSVEHGSTGNRAKPGDSVEHGSTSNRAEPGDSVEHGSTSNRAEPGDSVEHGSGSEGAPSDDGDEPFPPNDEVPEGTFEERTPGDESDPDVSVCVGRTDDGFYVADDGPGIDPDEREAVFEPGHTTATDGTGFGLAIVQRIVEAHGWSITVTESHAGGARFEVHDVDVVRTPETDRVADAN